MWVCCWKWVVHPHEHDLWPNPDLAQCVSWNSFGVFQRSKKLVDVSWCCQPAVSPARWWNHDSFVQVCPGVGRQGSNVSPKFRPTGDHPDTSVSIHARSHCRGLDVLTRLWLGILERKGCGTQRFCSFLDDVRRHVESRYSIQVHAFRHLSRCCPSHGKRRGWCGCWLRYNAWSSFT